MKDFGFRTAGTSDAPTTNARLSTVPDQTRKSFWSSHVRITIHEAECRDHLALERTFLAYIRTASAFAQFGIVVAQLFRLTITSEGVMRSSALRIGKALGATTEALAIVIALIGAAYFAKQQSALMDKIILARGWDVLTMFIFAFLVGTKT